MIGYLIFGLVLSCAQSYHHQTQTQAPFGYQVAVNFGSQQQPQPTWNAPQQQASWNAQPQPTWNAQPQPTWNAQPQSTWNAQPQPTWNAQPQQYTAQKSASLHQRRLSDPNWAVNSPIQPWEAQYNGPEPQPTTYSKPQQTWSKPQTYVQPKKQSKTSYSAPNLALHQQRLNDPLWAVKGSNVPSSTFGYQYTTHGGPQNSWQQNSVSSYTPGHHVPASHTSRHDDPLWAIKEQGGHYRFKRSTVNVHWAAPNSTTAGINNVNWAAPNPSTAVIDNVNWAAPNPSTAGIDNVNWAAPNPSTAGIDNVNWAAPNPATAGINNVNWAAPNPNTAGTLNVNWAAPAGNNNPLWALG